MPDDTTPADAPAPPPLPVPPADVAPAVAADAVPDTGGAAPETVVPDNAPARAQPTPAQTGAKLAERFPALFGRPQPAPLKLRVQADIQQRAPGEFTRRALSAFLHRYTTATPYLQALVRDAQRLDLDGAPAGDVAAEHRSAAEAELARRRELAQQRRAAERAKAREKFREQAREQRQAAPAQVAPADGAPRADRPPRPPRPGRAENAARPGRPARPAGPPGAARPPRPPGQPQAGRADGRAPDAAAPRGEPPAPRPDDPAWRERRERQLLLRAWESSPLTKANFCTLKRISEAELDAAIAQARQEASTRR
jgi:sRNA-binding protein